jgi:hypothetical protein
MYWDEYVVRRHGATWFAFGLNRADTVTGPGARDAAWLGVLARATRRGVTGCRPRIFRTHWTESVDRLSWAESARLRCRRLHAHFTSEGRGSRLLDVYFEAAGTARVGGRGRGIAWYFGQQYQ